MEYMKSKSYRYSRSQVFYLLFIYCIGGFLIARGIIHSPPKTMSWTIFIIAIFLLLIYRFYEVIFLHMVPLFKRKSALELDNEKLFYGAKNKKIYWVDIKQIKSSPYGIFPIKLILNNGKKVGIYQSEIRGEEKEIYEDILAYFNQSKSNNLGNTIT